MPVWANIKKNVRHIKKESRKTLEFTTPAGFIFLIYKNQRSLPALGGCPKIRRKVLQK